MCCGQKSYVFKVTFGDASTEPPFRIRNLSHVEIEYRQKGTSCPYIIQPSTSVSYAWDDIRDVYIDLDRIG